MFLYKNWKYKNTLLLITSLVVVFYMSNTSIAKDFLTGLGDLGYLGAFLAGMFFVSVFTVAPASIVLFFLAGNLNPVLVAVVAGVGAVIGDYFIFKFLKDRVFEELTPLFNRYGGSYFSKLLHTPYFAWLMPFIGALIVASPFPDEIGLGLMGLSKIKIWQFILVTFLLNSVGILIIVSLANQS